MDNPKICALIKDLLPQYCDNATSTDSNEYISLHLKECKKCGLYEKEIRKENKNISKSDSVVSENTNELDNNQATTEKYKTIAKHLYILKLTNFREDLAEELTQETFYQTFISFYKFRGECNIKTWICQIAKNTCFKYYLKNKLHKSINLPEFNNMQLLRYDKPIEKYIEDKELSMLIISKIKELKKKYRDILIYRLYFELPYSQICKIMHIRESSAKVIYFRGKEMLKDKLNYKIGNNIS